MFPATAIRGQAALRLPPQDPQGDDSGQWEVPELWNPKKLSAPQKRIGKQRWIDLLHDEREATAFSSDPQGKSCRCYVPQW